MLPLNLRVHGKQPYHTISLTAKPSSQPRPELKDKVIFLPRGAENIFYKEDFKLKFPGRR